jgi:hypothetical protein
MLINGISGVKGIGTENGGAEDATCGSSELLRSTGV